MEEESWGRNLEEGIWEASGKHLGDIWEASGRPLGSILEASGSIRWLGSTWSIGGPFSIIKMQSNRRDRPFYRRVAKVGGTKYRKTHGSRASEGGGGQLRRGPAVGRSCKLWEILTTR